MLEAAKKRKVEKARKELVYYHIHYIVYLVAKSIRVKGVERDLIKGTSVCRAQCTVSVCCVCVCEPS